MAIRATVLVVLLLAAGSASAAPRKLLNGAVTWTVGYSVKAGDVNRAAILGGSKTSGDASAGSGGVVGTPAGGRDGVSHGAVLSYAFDNGAGARSAGAKAVGQQGNDAIINLSGGTTAGGASAGGFVDIAPGMPATTGTSSNTGR